MVRLETSVDTGADQKEAGSTAAGDAVRVARPQLWLARHGETAWSASGQHTGRTDLPLLPVGEERAKALGQLLNGRRFAIVLVSPRQRAMETCRIAGYAQSAIVEPNLQEWDYGDYEGKTTQEIQAERPGWSIWDDGVPNGETIQQVANRARLAIDRALSGPGDALLFAHGHILRVLASCWLDMAPDAGRHFALSTASLSVLGYEHATRTITRWNQVNDDRRQA